MENRVRIQTKLKENNQRARAIWEGNLRWTLMIVTWRKMIYL